MLDFSPLLDRIGDARVVMLGEASDGTHQYYEIRAAPTRRLIAELGFSFVAVEGDWPDCERINQAVTTGGDSPEALGVAGRDRRIRSRARTGGPRRDLAGVPML